MPIDRDYLLAPKSNHSTLEGTMERLVDELSKTQEPQTKQFWKDIIQSHTQVNDHACTAIFNQLIIKGTLSFLRVYQGHAIYRGPATPMILHDKMPVVELET